MGITLSAIIKDDAENDAPAEGQTTEDQPTEDQPTEEKTPDWKKRLINAIGRVPVKDYIAWITHSTTFFPRCLAKEDNL
ncbi:hypothetical protein BDB00DRAFT_876287 [Zychaea mexicana]|uniref:uncharacterized protein n=1 Tax=Zychaea mexicana TaxID=64656 RepID=UPI0022FE86F6|nr:uncharacterized protein BDB00DRAFT_876287 [Zychaea mexicana]KAI9489523.1 hypothetical protein BDB00DRAFT_876287 [Zychaea mexicana]